MLDPGAGEPCPRAKAAWQLWTRPSWPLGLLWPSRKVPLQPLITRLLLGAALLHGSGSTSGMEFASCWP